MRSLMVLAAVVLGGCSHTLANRSEADNTINAPIATVWEATLFVLPTRNVRISHAEEDRWLLRAAVGVSAFSWGQNIEIQYTKRDESHTVASMSAKARYGRIPNVIDGLFGEIKAESERRAAASPAPK